MEWCILLMRLISLEDNMCSCRIGTLAKYSVFVFVVLLFLSCNLSPQVAVLEIKNISGHEVRDLTFSYEHASEKKLITKKIASLPNNKSKKYNLELTSPSTAIGAGMVVVMGTIEYYINGVKYNMDNNLEKEDKYLDLADGDYKTIVTINETGWNVIRKKK
jgi:hypothetical protein